MGVFSKLKGIFYDEVVVEEPEEEIKKVDKILKREVVVEEPVKEVVTPVSKVQFDDFDDLKEAKEETRHSERELFRSERTFNFTEFDDDEELPPRKTVMSNEMQRQSRVVEPVKPVIKPVVKPVEPPQPKVFKPSPIISPIYGILDKDYKKDEIKTRNVVNNKPTNIKITSYDVVRRKAYGTLEDDLEDTLNSMESISIEDDYEKVNNKPNVSQNNDRTSKIEELINQIDDVSYELDKSMSIGDIEDTVQLENFELHEDITDKTMTDSSLEHDLFNLIDSMYDDKED